MKTTIHRMNLLPSAAKVRNFCYLNRNKLPTIRVIDLQQIPSVMNLMYRNLGSYPYF